MRISDKEKVLNFADQDTNIKTVLKAQGRRKVYLVGGTIRDIVLNRDIKDYDFSITGSGITFARSFAKKIKGAFVLLSREEDEARVVKDNTIFDFIGLNRKPIEADLQRRDFTINAMALECASREFLDLFNSLKDLRHKMIRPITGNSLKQDPLRILRGFRFSLELGFRLHKDFIKQAKNISLKDTAAERIGYELLRIMSVPDSYGTVLKMDKLGLFAKVFPEANKILEDPYLWGHSLNTYFALEQLMQRGFFVTIEPEFSRYFAERERIPILKLAGLFHDIAKPDTFLLKQGEVHFYGHDTKGAKIVSKIGRKRLKLPGQNITMWTKLVKEHMRLHLLATNPELTDRAIRRFLRDLGENWFGAMMIAWADGYATAGWTKHLEEVFTRMIELKRTDDAKPKIVRLVNGHDLIALGLVPGPKFKVILQELFDLQLEDKIRTKEQGLKIAIQIGEKLDKEKKNATP